MSPSWLLAKRDPSQKGREGKCVLCWQQTDLSFLPLGGAGKQGKPHLPPQSKRCSSQTGRTEVDTWIHFMWELLVSSVGMLVNTIFWSWIWDYWGTVLFIPLSKLTKCIGMLGVCLRVPFKMDWLSPSALPALSQLLGWDEAVILPALL